jgi:hypothetical protein
MPRGLREQLIGAWKLISYEERPVDGSPITATLIDAYYFAASRCSGSYIQKG